jgi:purine catabolism regulator
MLIEKRAAGLGIKLGVFISDLPQDIIAIADKNQFPILSIPLSFKYSSIVQSVWRRLSGKKQYAHYISNVF